MASLNEIAINCDLGCQGFKKTPKKMIWACLAAMSKGSDFAKIILVSNLITAGYVQPKQLEIIYRMILTIQNPKYAGERRAFLAKLQEELTQARVAQYVKGKQRRGTK